ncbi:serine hydrolase, partial [Stenotrophomonas indicatrix]
MAIPTAPAGAVDTARLDADIAFVGQHEHLPGLAMAVVEDGQVVYRHAEGARGDGGRIDEDTLFKIASNSKAMTAALL